MAKNKEIIFQFEKALLKTFLFLLVSCILTPYTFGQKELTAKEVVIKAYEKMKGESTGFSSMKMDIIRPTWNRTISFKSWSKSTELALSLVTAPKKEEGQTFLKRGKEMWSWNPIINRMIKLPPSMMSQGWMGSDFTNDDLLNEASMVDDYSHRLSGYEKVGDKDCYLLELTPKENAAVVWGKLKMWISKGDFLQMKTEFFDEEGKLMKTQSAFDIKKMGGRIIPTRVELNPADKPGNKTVITLESVEFNKAIPDQFFSQQNMKIVK
ncbi:MAG: outer membrane lipoprotein-sorting protein [Prolixibacteraceae bacterium]